MIRSFIRWLQGYIRLCVAGYSPERFLNMCCFHNLFIWGLEPTEKGYEMYMSISDFRKLKPLVRKTHTKVTLEGRYGFPFFLARYRKRKLFFAGLFLCAALLWGYSLFIWDIHFEGNERYPDTTLAEFLESEGVAPAMLRSRVDCPGIVKAIRKEYNDIVWVSASIDGSRLKIQVKENEDTFPDEETLMGEEKPVDLIASADGVITDEEIRTLNTWISSNDYLTGCYPFDEIESLLLSILNDGIVTEDERNMLKAFLSNFIDLKSSYNLNSKEIETLRKHYSISGICAICQEIEFDGNQFCFTGQSLRAKRKEIADLITSLGGKFNNSITNKTRYLIVGNDGNPCWAFSCYGRKIEDAVNRRKAGQTLTIVNEVDFWDAVDDLV